MGQLLVVVPFGCSTARTDPWSSSSEQQSTGWTWDQFISACVCTSTCAKKLIQGQWQGARVCPRWPLASWTKHPAGVMLRINWQCPISASRKLQAASSKQQA